jgi:L-histidine Nalpha-methyltransferase
LKLIDLAPDVVDFMEHAASSLALQPPQLSCKYLYDETGSQLFEAITQVSEYYLTRVERLILETHQDAIARAIGPQVRLVEFGAGLSDKTRRLVASLESPQSVVLIDISKEALTHGATALQARFPELEVTAICADYQQAIGMEPSWERTVVFFPGSTLGNFSASEATAFLGRVASMAGADAGLLLGVDLVKDPDVLVAAYDDSQGVTSAFNVNLLRRLSTDGAEVRPGHFRHEARWVEDQARIELHLVATQPTQIKVRDTELKLQEGDSIFTESCHKYTSDGIRELLAAAGWTVRTLFTDPEQRFAVVWATTAA